MNMFGSVLKDRAMSKVSKEMRDKAKEGIKSSYLRKGYGCSLWCDYDPCTELYNILLEAGILQHDINNICPWKTNIRIMPEDIQCSYILIKKMNMCKMTINEKSRGSNIMYRGHTPEQELMLKRSWMN